MLWHCPIPCDWSELLVRRVERRALRRRPCCERQLDRFGIRGQGRSTAADLGLVSDQMNYSLVMPREIGCFRFRSPNNCRSRPRPASVKAGHPVPPANQVVTGSPAFAGDDTQVMQLFSDAYLRAL